MRRNLSELRNFRKNFAYRLIDFKVVDGIEFVDQVFLVDDDKVSASEVSDV